MTVYNDPNRIDIAPDLQTGPTVSTDTELTKRIESLRSTGSLLFDYIERDLEALGRKPTEPERQQLNEALALFYEYLRR